MPDSLAEAHRVDRGSSQGGAVKNTMNPDKGNHFVHYVKSNTSGLVPCVNLNFQYFLDYFQIT
jgi:hypothetical protein